MKKSASNPFYYKDLEKYENEWINNYYDFFKNNHDFTKNKSLKIIYLVPLIEKDYDSQGFIFRNLNESIKSDKCLKKIIKDFFPDFNDDLTKREAIIMLSGKNILLLDRFYALPYIEFYQKENSNKTIIKDFKEYYDHNYAKFNKILSQLHVEMDDDVDIEIRILFSKTDY